MLDRVDANMSVTRYVWMEDTCQETHYWWAHGVAVRNLYVQVEQSTLVRAANRTCYGCLPMATFLIQRSSFYTFRRIRAQTCSKFTPNIFKCNKVLKNVYRRLIFPDRIQHSKTMHDPVTQYLPYLPEHEYEFFFFLIHF